MGFFELYSFSLLLWGGERWGGLGEGMERISGRETGREEEKDVVG